MKPSRDPEPGSGRSLFNLEKKPAVVVRLSSLSLTESYSGTQRKLDLEFRILGDY